MGKESQVLVFSAEENVRVKRLDLGSNEL